MIEEALAKAPPIEIPEPEKLKALITPAEEERVTANIRHLIEVLNEIEERKSESLLLYEPGPTQKAAHASGAAERLVRGGNRAGKTLWGAVEIARAVTGQDPYNKYPKEGCRVLWVGKDSNHIGRVMARKLLKPGAFWIIRDPHTGEWRSVRPWLDYDQEMKERKDDKGWKKAPPLIPKRFIKRIAWENHSLFIPNVIYLENDHEVIFASSNSAPVAGVELDLAAFDEEIIHPDWYPETQARLVDRGGRFFWAATPQNATAEMYDMYRAATAQDTRERRDVEDYCLLTHENPHLSEKARKTLEKKLRGAEEKAVRLHGAFRLAGRLVYPEYSPEIHDKELSDLGLTDIPADWMIRVYVDPGVNPGAGLIMVWPSPDSPWSGHAIAWRELYIQRCTAMLLAQDLHTILQARQQPEAFMIDTHGANLTSVATGDVPLDVFTREFKALGLKSHATGAGFLKGQDNEQKRIHAVKRWLEPSTALRGLPKLLVIPSTTKALRDEFQHYMYKKGGQGLVLNTTVKMHDHLMDCLGMAAAEDPEWVKPNMPGGVTESPGGLFAWLKKQKRNMHKSISLGAGRGL